VLAHIEADNSPPKDAGGGDHTAFYRHFGM
jgi:hypothetical protein